MMGVYGLYGFDTFSSMTGKNDPHVGLYLENQYNQYNPYMHLSGISVGRDRYRTIPAEVGADGR